MPAAAGLLVLWATAVLHWSAARASQRAVAAKAPEESSASSSSSTAAVRTRFSPFPFPLRYAVAPMVAQSDLPFRLLTRRYGATVCYTPMLYAARFVEDEAYQRDAIDFDPASNGTAPGTDRPLIVQFAANDPATLVEAARIVQHLVDAVDINLGCPQDRAREGHYGSYLLARRDWPLVRDMVRACHDALSVPVTCKIRLLDSFDDTLAFCRMLEDAGCAMIAVHARKRGSDKRRRVGPADLAQVARLRTLLRVPILANGNIRCFEDAEANLRATGAEGVMSAEAVLACPRLFAADAALRQAPAAEMAREYLSECLNCISPPPLHWISDHVHNIVRAHIERNKWPDLRARLKAVGRERPHAEGLGPQSRSSEEQSLRAQEYAHGFAAMEGVLVEVEQRLAALQQQGGADAARALVQQQRALKRKEKAVEEEPVTGLFVEE